MLVRVEKLPPTKSGVKLYLVDNLKANFEDSDEEQSASDFESGIRADYNLPRRFEGLASVHTQEVRCIVILEYASFC